VNFGSRITIHSISDIALRPKSPWLDLPVFDARSQALRVIGRVRSIVVVEIHVDGRSRRGPSANAIRPSIELRIRVPAPVEHAGAVKTHVREAGGSLDGGWVLPGGIGSYERDIVLLEETQSLLLEPALVPDLKSVPETSVSSVGRAKGAASCYSIVVPPREALSGTQIVGEQFEETARAIE